MRLLRRFPMLAFSLVLLSIIGVSIAQDNVTLLLVAGVLAAASWYVTEGPRGRTLPRWVSNIIVLGITLYVLLELVQRGSQNALPLLGQFVTLLTVVKLYERKTPRDYASLLSLSLLLMLTGCLQTSEFMFGVVLLVYIILGLYVILLFQLYAAYEDTRQQRDAATPEEARFVMPLRPAFGRHEGMHFRALAVVVGVVGFSVSTMVFFFVPRNVGAGIIPGAPGHQRTEQRTGFDSSIDLITGGRITTSHADVLSLQVVDGDGEAVRFDRPLLLRGAVLSIYDANLGRWEPRRGHSRTIQVDADTAASLLQPAQTAGTMYDFRFNIAQPSDVLFSLGRPVSLRADERINVEFKPSPRTLHIARNSTSPNAYAIRVQVPPTDGAYDASRFIAPPIVSDDSGHGPLYRGNGVTSQIEDLTKRVLRDAGITSPQPYEETERAQWNRDAAEAIVAFLRSPRFTYTLDLSDVVRRMDNNGRPQDPTEQFLFETRRGHCEYFASAMALMCRSVGVPARLISGYVAYNYDRQERAYRIVQANAHAWVEVQTMPGEWETFDPTPQSDFDRQHDAPINAGNRLRALYDDIERGWTNNFVRFNRDTQTQMVHSLEGTWWQRLRDIGEGLRNWARRVNRAFYFGPAGYIWLGLVGLVIIVAMIAIVKYARRAWRLREVLALEDVNRSGRRRMRRQLAFYLDMLNVLERGGLAKPDWQPPQLFAHALLAGTTQSTGQPEPTDSASRHAEQPQQSIGEIVRELTDLFYAGRYGNRRLDDEQTRRAHSMLRELADRLKVRL